MRYDVVAATFLVAAPLHADTLVLIPPIDCALGEGAQCYVQYYMDQDPTGGVSDHTCNDLSYDGHKGTDFALRTHAAIADDIAVVAAAPGIVTATRDGMADRVYDPKDASVEGKDCGNGVVIQHSQGWETQYCHLRQGSLRAKRGQRVQSGDTLGFVGMSGRASFPHVHLSVRRDGTPVDPYSFSSRKVCAPDSTADTLWDVSPAYQATGLISAGFAAHLPTYDDVKAGKAHTASQAISAGALVLWGFAYGSHPGDVLRLRIMGPDGRLVYDRDVTIEKRQAQYFRAGGRKTDGADWYKPGAFTGTVSILRDGTLQSQMTTNLTVTD